MAAARVPVTFDPNTRKVEAAFARIQAQAKGINLGAGASSIDKLSRPLGRITGQANEFQKSLEASNARVLAFGASVAVINKLSEAFGALVSNTVKVEATFAKINTILGGTQAQIEQFGNGIFKVAQNTATSFDQVAEGALELARQGLSVEESLSRVETALQLVRVTGIKSTEAVAGLTAAIKGFEGAGLTVVEIADKLSQVDTQFAVSTEDLINGLERASASARVAGVSFDELLGVITTVQERTQRGGAVIGNAFKTIFARLGRTDTLVALQDLGISVLDTEGNVRSAIPLFEELATELDKLGLKSVEAGEVIQKVAGVRQRDILISLVEDLNSGQSQFAKSLEVSAGAAGALDAKNESLNQTLEALINNLTVGGQKLASVLGEIGFTDAAGDILKAISSVVNGITDILQGESIGAKFAQGLVKGVGNILTGPGLALISAIFIKLFVDLAKFGSQSLKQILGINQAAQAQNLLQQSILQTLLQNEDIQREILALEGNKIAQEKLLLRIYNEQANALARVQKAAATVTPGVFGAGFRGGERGVTRRGASGYVAAEARDVSRGVGGATAGSKVVSIPNFAFGGGKYGTMVANTSEYIVPNYAGGGDAIFNRDMVRSMGLPSGARKLNAAAGFIPNFARTRVGAGLPADNIYRTNNLSELTRIDPSKLKGKARKDYDAALAAKQKTQVKPLNLNASAYSYLVPQFNFSRADKTPIRGRFRKGKKSFPFSLSGFSAFGPKIPGKVAAAGDPQDEFLEENITNSLVRESKKYADILTRAINGRSVSGGNLRSKFSSGGTKGAFGALRSAVGSAFEIATTEALGIDDASVKKGGGDFDIRNPSPSASKKLKALFGSAGGRSKGEFKVSDSIDNIASFAKKIATETGKASNGFIPNFAGGLEDAIERERAAGVPINQIRINQDGSLRNSQNPKGLAVTNMRDEPTGRIPNFQQTFIGPQRPSDMINVSKAFDEMAQKANKAGSAFESSMGKIFALQFAVSGLTGVIGEQEGATGALIDGINSATTALFALSAINLSPLGAFGKGGALTKSVRGGTGLLAAFKGITGVMAKLRAVAGPVALGFVAISTATKMITGKGLFQLLGESFGILATETQKATQKINEAGKALQPGREGIDVGENIRSIGAAVRAARERAGIEAATPTLKGASADEIRLAGIIRANPNLQDSETLRGKSFTMRGYNVGFGEDFIFDPNAGDGLNPFAISQDFGNIDFTDRDRDAVVERLQESLFKNAEEIITSLESQTGLTASPEQAKRILDRQNQIVETFFKNVTKDQPEGFDKIIKAANVKKALDRLTLGLESGYEQLIAELEAQTTQALTQAEIDASEGTKVISTLDRDIKLARRQGKLARFEGFKVGPGGVTSPTSGPSADTARSLEIQVELSRNLSSLAKERLQAEKNMLDFQIKSQDANRDIGAGLAENVATLLKGRAVYKDQEEAILELVSSGKSFEEILEEVNGLVDQNSKSFGQISDEFTAIIKKAEDENRLLQIRNSFEERRLVILKQQAAMSPLERSNQKRVQDLENLSNTLPDTLANNLESSLTTALNNVATGAETNLGTIFGNIALDFGKTLQQEINRAIAKDIVSNITGGGGFQNFFGNTIGSIFGRDSSGGNFNKGGLVSGGSGVRDDVPAKLTGGEYVIRKAAVQKYGPEFFDQINSKALKKMRLGGILEKFENQQLLKAQEEQGQEGEFFVPGTRGGGQIVGKENLLAFANQEFTSGATDIIRSTGSGAYIDLEDQSLQLTQFGRFRDSPARRALKAAQKQALDLYNARMAEEKRVREANKAKRKRFQGAVLGAFVQAGLQAGVGAVFSQNSLFNRTGDLGKTDLVPTRTIPGGIAPYIPTQIKEGGDITIPETDYLYQSRDPTQMYSANGGAIGSNTNALLMGGEYVLSPQAANSMGRQVLDDINNMRMPRMMMANGGAVGEVSSSSSAESSSADIGAVNIEINMKDDGSTDVNASTNGGGRETEAKEFAKRVKEVVVGVIAEEKRVSGSLFTRRK